MEEVRIYTAEQRGETLAEAGIVRSTLNYEGYVSAHRQPIDILRHVNEWEAEEGKTVELLVEADTVTLLIPLLDGILVEVDGKKEQVLVGNVFVWKAQESRPLLVHALAESEEPFAFQQIVFISPIARNSFGTQYGLPIIDPEAKNKMLPVLADSSLPFQLYVGAFLGKSEFNLGGVADKNYHFVIALDGTFEVEERLLFTGDSLALENYPQLAVECLSSTGILLVLEF